MRAVSRSVSRRLLVITQALAMAQSTLLAIFALTGTITVWHVLVLCVALAGTVLLHFADRRGIEL